jgi:hypothetical protein
MVALVAAGVLVLGACGSDDGGDDDVALEDVADDDTTTTTEADEDDATTTTEADEDADDEDDDAGDGELPDFASDFDRVCSSQVGFDGAAAYDPATPGPHVLVLFESFGADGDLVQSGRSAMPAGWLLEEDGDFEDNSEMAEVELVGCMQRTEETANGTSCEFDDDGDVVTLELVDTVHELTLYAAATGDEVASTTLESASTECPFFATFDPEDLRFFNEPSDDELIAALAPTVEP